MKQVYVLLFFISTNIYAQKFHGQVFSTLDSLPLQDIKVVNVNQKKLTYSNENGEFYIKAKPNDIISFQSLFFEEKSIVYKDFDGKKLIVYLQEKTNILDEVAVMGVVKFDAEKLNSELNKSIKADKEVIKNKPPMYMGKTALEGNIFSLLGVIINIFKKEKSEGPVYISIDFDFLEGLFLNKQNMYNDKFLTEVLHIESQRKYLFFNYCDILKYTIPENEFNDFVLLDFLITQSENFNKQQKQ